MAAMQLEPSPNGAADLGLRKGAFSAQLLTDTLDLRWSPELRRGRWWVAGRAEGFGALLLFDPWTDGAPDPSRALSVSYAGLEGGGLAYLPRRFYVGAQLYARYFTFQALDSTEIPVPDSRPVVRPEAVLGYWTPAVNGWAVAGVSLGPDLLAPHAYGQLLARPCFTGEGCALAPRAELRAGWAEAQDALTLTRLGGTNPYVVPLAGAGWAEFWVEDYAALRAGPDLQLPAGEGVVTLAVVADVAWFNQGADTTSQRELGFAGVTGWRRRRLSADAVLGYAPWLERAEGVSAITGWLAFSADWGPVGRSPTADGG